MSTRSRTSASAVADSVPFDNSSNGFVGTTVQEAIEEVATASKYPRRKILSGETILVRDEESWSIYQQIEIFNTGTLVIEGEVFVSV